MAGHLGGGRMGRLELAVELLEQVRLSLSADPVYRDHLSGFNRHIDDSHRD